MNNIKIKLTSETVTSATGEILYRIEAIEDIPAAGIKKGDKGGFIASLEVKGNARISGNARVSGDAQVSGNARVSGNAQVSGNAIVDSLSAILTIQVSMKYSITVTRKHVQVGCQLFKRSEVKTMTKAKAEKLGLDSKFYEGYMGMIKSAMKLVKEKE